MQPKPVFSLNDPCSPKRTTADWIRYFHWNRQNLTPIPWDHPYRLTPAEWSLIADSIAIFQLGENSEGRHLKKAGDRYTEASGDHQYAEALRLFIAEEQRHAGYLARFMKQQRIPLARHHWTDLVFRTLRRMWNLELCVAVLMVAELVAKVYYRALRAATQSSVLKQICTQLLSDEVQHVYFHTSTLAALRKGRSPAWSALFDWLYSVFFQATLAAVWIGHAKVFRAGGFSFRRFWKTALLHLRHAHQLVVSETAQEESAPAKRVIHGMESPFQTHLERITLKTDHCMQFIDLTDRITRIIAASRIENGIVNIQTRHTTTGIVVNENEPLLLDDMRQILEAIAPQDRDYRHNDFTIRTVNMGPAEDKNGHSHCKSLFLPTAESLNVVAGKLELGLWQRIFLLELDRSRERTVSVMVMGTAKTPGLY
jgi:secondary thiamine-phosphate synthase enzyme